MVLIVQYKKTSHNTSYMDQIDITIHSAKESDRRTWDAEVNHPLQSWAWGEFRKSMGVHVERLIHKGKSSTDYWQLTFHTIPHTPWTIAYFPKGPKPTRAMVTALRNLGKSRNAVYIQIEPDLEINHAGTLTTLGLKKSHHPLFTKYSFVLDITLPEEELLARMHQKTRYNIKVAQKHNVIVREDNSDEAFSAYLALEDETTKRQGFYAHSRMYHETMWRILHKEGIAKLWTATYNNTILSAWVLFIWKDTVYYPYGSSSREYRNVMAPTIMLWEIARWAKKNGFKKFDLWGALGPDPNPSDPWYGFHRFKQGFNPSHIEFAGSYDVPIQPLLYKGFTIANNIRWHLLNYKNKRAASS